MIYDRARFFCSRPVRRLWHRPSAMLVSLALALLSALIGVRQGITIASAADAPLSAASAGIGTVFSDGFESGGLAANSTPPGAWAWSLVPAGATLAAVSAARGAKVHSGTYSMQVTAIGSGGNSQVREDFSALSTLYYRYYFYLPGNWTLQSKQHWHTSVVSALNGGSELFPGQTTILLDNSGALSLTYFDAAKSNHTLGTTAALTLGQWHYVEVAETVGSQGTLSLSVDGSGVASVNGVNLGYTPISRMRMGSVGVDAVSGTLYLDDVVIGSGPLGSTTPTSLVLGSASTTTGAGEVSQPITVSLTDATGAAAQAGPTGVTVQLASTSQTGTFALTPSFATTVQTVAFAPFASTATFYYRDPAVGKPTLTVSSSNLGTSVLTGLAADSSQSSGLVTANMQVSVVPAASRLLVALPGQTYVSGIGITGTPLPESMSVPFTVTVYAVNNALVLDPGAGQIVTLQTTDPRAILPPATALSGGQIAVLVTLDSLQSTVITSLATLQGNAVQAASPPVAVTFLPNGTWSQQTGGVGGAPAGWSFSSGQSLINETVLTGSSCNDGGGLSGGFVAQPTTCLQMSGAAQIPNPTSGPIVSAGGNGGTLAPGFYAYTYAWGSKVTSLTLPSPMTWVHIAAGQTVSVRVPAWPQAAVGVQIYRSAVMTSTIVPALGQTLADGWLQNGITTYTDSGNPPLQASDLILYNHTAGSGTIQPIQPIAFDATRPLSLTFLALGTIDQVTFSLSGGPTPTAISFPINQTFARWTPVRLVISPYQYAGNTQVAPQIQVGQDADQTNMATASIANASMSYYVAQPVSSTINYKAMDQGDVVNSSGATVWWSWLRSGTGYMDDWDPAAMAAQIKEMHDVYGVRLIRVHIGLDQLFDAWDPTTGYHTNAANTATTLDMGTNGTHSWNTNAINNFQTYLNDLPADTQLQVTLFREYYPSMFPSLVNVFLPSAFRPVALDGLHAQMRANYLQATYDFINRFKSNPHIKIWDMFNEYTSIQGGGQNGYVPVYAMRSFLSDMYHKIKPIVPSGQYLTADITMGSNIPTDMQAQTSYYQWFAGMSDLYDAHMYTNTPSLIDYSILPVPVTMGEFGANTTETDLTRWVNAFQYFYTNGQANHVAMEAAYAFGSSHMTTIRYSNIFTLQTPGQWISNFTPASLITTP